MKLFLTLIITGIVSVSGVTTYDCKKEYMQVIKKSQSDKCEDIESAIHTIIKMNNNRCSEIGTDEEYYIEVTLDNKNKVCKSKKGRI